MIARTLGRTGLQVSPIGFGAFKIGRNEKIKYATPYDLPHEREVRRLFDGLLDLGITYFDTAPAYGLSEERVGRLLHRRPNVVISTKVGENFESGESNYDFTPEAMRASIHRSLKRLNVETLDLAFLHTPADDQSVLKKTSAVSVLQELKAKGDVRYIGFSGKTSSAARLAMDWADVLMVEYHLADSSHAEIIAEAHRRGIGVVVKKGLASGRLAPEAAIPFVLENSGVGSLIVGGLNPQHMRKNVEIVERNQRLERSDSGQ